MTSHSVANDPQPSKLRGELATVVASSTGTMIPISIVMDRQATAQQMAPARVISDKATRRDAVIETLRSTSAAAQHSLLQWLATRQPTGTVAENVTSLWIHNVIVTEATADVILEIADRSDVAWVNWNRPVPVDDVLTDGQSCGLETTGAVDAWNRGFRGAGVVVALIDSGLCLTHPDLSQRVWVNTDEIPGNGVDDDGNGFVDDVHGWNFGGMNNDLTDNIYYPGHGTPVAGLIAGDGTNGTRTGVAPEASLMVLKIGYTFTDEASVWSSIQYALANGADVMNGSLGWPHSVDPDRATWRAVVENAMHAGPAMVFAAGNDGNSYPPVGNINTPGDVPDVITVGATDCENQIEDFSSLGPTTWEDVPPYSDWPYPPGLMKPTLSAPGGFDLVSTSTSSNCSDYSIFAGTSAATPHVSGVVALMLEADPTLDHFAVKSILEWTAIDQGDPDPDNTYGAGTVDALAAVELALLNKVDVPATSTLATLALAGLLMLLAAWRLRASKRTTAGRS